MNFEDADRLESIERRIAAHDWHVDDFRWLLDLAKRQQSAHRTFPLSGMEDRVNLMEATITAMSRDVADSKEEIRKLIVKSNAQR